MSTPTAAQREEASQQQRSPRHIENEPGTSGNDSPPAPPVWAYVDVTSEDLRRLLDARGDVTKLMSTVSRQRTSAGAAGAGEESNLWLAPIDASADVVMSQDVLKRAPKQLPGPTGTTAASSSAPPAGPPGSSISDIYARSRSCGERILLRCPPISGSDGSALRLPTCPDLDDIKLQLFKEKFTMTVLSLLGYNFSLEYSQIYRAKSDASFFPLDVFSVCQRALIAFDPFLSADALRTLAEFIVRASYWEAVKAPAAGDRALTAAFPDANVGVDDSEASVAARTVRAYVGFDPVDMRLCLHVRVAMGVRTFTADDAVRANENKVTKNLELISYQKYDLDVQSVERVDELMSFADTQEESSGDAQKTSSQGTDRGILEKSFIYLKALPDYTASASQARDDDNETGGREGADESTRGDGAEEGHDDHDGVATPAIEGAPGVGGKSKDILPLITKHRNQEAYRDPSPTSELMVWGSNEFNSMGCAEDVIEDPRPMPRPLSLCLERVKMVSCSARHTLVLTSLGLVYSCGDNTEGALGSGDVTSRYQMQVVSQWWAVPKQANLDGDRFILDDSMIEHKVAERPPFIVQVAAGGGFIGSHSMAIDEDGNLYGWGVAQATGHGVNKPVTSPKQVSTFPIPQTRQPGEGPERVWAEAEAQTVYYTRGIRPVTDVACGGGFTVAVLRDTGEVCAWGTWQHGRLGRPTPLVEAKRRRRMTDISSGKRQYARYQLRPILVPGIRDAVRVACGTAHTLCLIKHGYILSWGANSCGQLGIGVTKSGFLRDEFTPRYVAPFQPKSAVRKSDSSPYGRKAILVACGTFHSVAVEQGGAVWSWGARGHPTTGHNDAAVAGSWGSRVNSVFNASGNTSKIMIPYELVPWCNTWSRPRLVKALAEVIASDREDDDTAVAVIKEDAPEPTRVSRHCRIVQVACGDMHTAFMSGTGRLYLCGEGHVIPPFITVQTPIDDEDVERQDDVDISEKELTELESSQREESRSVPDADAGVAAEAKESSERNEKSAVEALDTKGKPKETINQKIKRDAESLPDNVSTVYTPRSPSSLWMSRLASRRTVLIAAAGSHMMALQDDDLVASAASARMFMNLQSEQEQMQYAEDLGAVVREATDAPGAISVKLEEDDEDDDGNTDGSIASSSANRTAKSIFEQRGYADCLLISSGKILMAHRAILSARSPVLRDKLIEESPGGDDLDQPTQLLLPELLHGTARVLLQYLYTDNIPRRLIGDSSMLRNLSRAALQLRIPRLQVICHQLMQLNSSGSSSGSKDEPYYSSAVGSEVIPSTLSRDFGNIVGDPQYADIRFIVEGRFLFAHRFVLEARSTYFRAMFRSGMLEAFVVNGKPTDIVVPDSFVCLLRMLIFLYTDLLPEGNDSSLLEDLITADRYQLSDMKCMCESMIVPTKTNWLEVLRVADLVNSSRLREETICFIRDHLSEAFLVPGAIQQSLEEFPYVSQRLFKMRQIAFPLPPSKILTDQVSTNVKLAEEKKRTDFPWKTVITMLVFIVIYVFMIREIRFGPFVPLMNLFMTVGMAVVLYFQLMSA